MILRLRTVLIFLAAVWFLQLDVEAAETGIFRDNFNRPAERLSLSPRWNRAHGGQPGSLVVDNRLVSDGYPLLGPDQLHADAFVGVITEDQRRQRMSIDFRMPDSRIEFPLPDLHLNLNWQGNEIFGPAYRFTVQGTTGIVVSKSGESGVTEQSSKHVPFAQGTLSPGIWYQATLERINNVVKGEITTQDGGVVSQARLVDEGTVLTGGKPVLSVKYSGAKVNQSLELDNFEYELDDSQSVVAFSRSAEANFQLDGRLDEDIWSKVSATKDFHPLDSNLPLDVPPTLRVIWDQDYLYVGIECPKRLGDDAEIFLDPFQDYRRRSGLLNDSAALLYNHRDARIFRFTVGVNGTHDMKLMNLPWWKVPWQSQVHVGDRAWTAELQIPLASLAFFQPRHAVFRDVEPGWSREWGINCRVGRTALFPSLDLQGFPTALGVLDTGEMDSRERRWVCHSGHGPRIVGDVQFWSAVINSTGQDRDVNVVYRKIDHQRPKTFSSLPAWSGKVTVADQRYRHARTDVYVPVTEPGDQLMMVSIVDPETKRPLVHQLHRIPGIAIGSTSWDRSYYMNEVEAQLDITLGRSIATNVNLTCELWGDDQPTPIRSQRISVDENGKAQVVFDVANLLSGSYRVKILHPHYNDYPLEARLRKLPHRSGAVQYTSHGTLLRDGQPIFPIGFYYVQHHFTDEFLKEYADAGFNTFCMEWLEAAGYREMSRWTSQFGVYPSVSLTVMSDMFDVKGNSAHVIRDRQIPRAEQAVAMLGNKSGDDFLFWYLVDEPNEATLRYADAMHQVVLEQDPYHPTFTTTFPPHLWSYHEATDIVAPDVYPSFPGGDISRVGDAVAAMVTRAGGKPVFAVLQTFFEEGRRMPNPAEVRCMSYLSIAQGASGLLFFSYDYRVGPMAKSHPDTWKELKQIAHEISTLEKILLQGPPDDRSLLKASPGLVYRLHCQGNEIYVIVVNQENRERLAAEFTLSNGKISEIEVLFEERDVHVEAGTWRDDFAPYAVRVYRVTKRN